ncbi:wax ester/triacylglycerol synthase family O-acyltransferase [Aquihabitans sp. G128]|uniref:WS/DGAT/MGAT family O-acyltransferase n=1 Tax=Aquihabitans sp. G128 TaxID=2849779 RepID=UPI001C226972|nr:wax ester/triacylglycerol synthase family O-acyltransferase [Aquihabitans sp. G128]QXC62460.1 wax ester/triacylglycerol synthase family O-acyltransferase [Aquihabitans sp. G128]
MKRLTGLDAGFLWMETPSSAMHVSGLAIYDPAGLHAGGTFGIENVRAMVRGRLHLAPPFRQRLVDVPLQLHFPLWIEDPNFSLDNHIRHVAVPAPGGVRELAELAAELNATQLDRSRPLWEMWYIEGLEGGRVATLTKVHHAAIDGASGSEITVALFDLSPEVTEYPPPDEPWMPDDVPSDLEMLRYATASLARQPLRVLKALRRTGRAALNVTSLARGEGSGLAPLPFTAPATSINGAISARRSVAVSSLSLSDVKRVKNAFGATVNDVVLALCAGALRRYFAERGEDVDGPLLAMVPVSVRSEDQKADMGNQVSSMFTTLATDVADPVARLRSIHEGMQGAKEQHRAIGADTLTDWAEFAAPAVFGRAMRLYARMGLADRHRPVFNLTISNVPGPPFPLYSAGAKLEANFPLGPIFDGAALNITVMSLEDSLDFGILTCPDVVDDVWSISDGLAASLHELLAAAELLEEEAIAVGTAPSPPATEASAPKAPVKEAPAKKAPAAKKARAAKEAPAAKRAPAKKAPAKKAPAAKRAPAKKAGTKRASVAKRAPAKRAGG